MTTPPLDPAAPPAGDPATPPVTDPATPPADPATPPVDPPATEEKVDDLPEWARKKLTSANAEAANYRTQLREAQDALSKAKTPEEVTAAIADTQAKYAQLETQLARTTAAAKHNLPPELAARVQGNTPEEMDADAKALAKFAVVPAAPGDLSGGLDPSSSDESWDPVAEAAKARAARY